MKEKLKIGIVAKPGHSQAKDLVEQLIKFIQEQSLEILVDKDTLALINSDNSSKDLAKDLTVERRRNITKTCDIAVILGGDGTLISVCRHPSKNSPRIIGVNLGTLGFLTEISIDELKDTLVNTINDKTKLEERKILEATILKTGQEAQTTYAINDVVISKETIARIFPTKISIDNCFAANLKGDGVIVSSPSGSTAYSLAAGGTIVHPQVDAMLITPICAHSLTSRPLVVPGHAEIELEIGKAEDVRSYLTVDGQEGYPLVSGDKVTVKTSKFAVRFVKSGNNSYYDILSSKLKWASM